VIGIPNAIRYTDGRKVLDVTAEPLIDRKARRRAAVRQEIIDAAWAVAGEHGLAGLTLRGVAERIGMRPPSLYAHFSSKNAIYDAMFGQAWLAYLDIQQADDARLEDLPPREALKATARGFFDFCVADPARYQLMNQRTIPDFRPSDESYAPALQVMRNLRRHLTAAGITDPDAADLFTALVGGLIDQQLANDPGGDRWRRLLDRAIDMYADEMGLPRSPSRTHDDHHSDPDQAA
jgi:AcrR family transcriptional regulator